MTNGVKTAKAHIHHSPGTPSLGGNEAVRTDALTGLLLRQFAVWRRLQFAETHLTGSAASTKNSVDSSKPSSGDICLQTFPGRSFLVVVRDDQAAERDGTKHRYYLHSNALKRPSALLHSHPLARPCLGSLARFSAIRRPRHQSLIAFATPGIRQLKSLPILGRHRSSLRSSAVGDPLVTHLEWVTGG